MRPALDQEVEERWEVRQLDDREKREFRTDPRDEQNLYQRGTKRKWQKPGWMRKSSAQRNYIKARVQARKKQVRKTLCWYYSKDRVGKNGQNCKYKHMYFEQAWEDARRHARETNDDADVAALSTEADDDA